MKILIQECHVMTFAECAPPTDGRYLFYVSILAEGTRMIETWRTGTKEGDFLIIDRDPTYAQEKIVKALRWAKLPEAYYPLGEEVTHGNDGQIGSA